MPCSSSSSPSDASSHHFRHPLARPMFFPSPLELSMRQISGRPKSIGVAPSRSQRGNFRSLPTALINQKQLGPPITNRTAPVPMLQQQARQQWLIRKKQRDQSEMGAMVQGTIVLMLTDQNKRFIAAGSN
ncbi:hypothetical protein niasHT_022121 [Heterodera trifolii]|uniref:Uncharacterized protein n=1 Tax=Heterodera trifolii TaxID=157864 RepID=A0ABD2K8Y3_9BILA